MIIRYVLAKLAQARQNNNEGKITKWEDFIKNMEGITVGSRTPVAGTPAWVTLEVAAGGILLLLIYYSLFLYY